MAINGVFLAVVGFAICAVLALLFAGPFLRSQTQIDYIVENGTDYLLICCCGCGTGGNSCGCGCNNNNCGCGCGNDGCNNGCC